MSLTRVIHNGTRAMQPLPAAPDMLVSPRLYEVQLVEWLRLGEAYCSGGHLREPLRSLRYDTAARDQLVWGCGPSCVRLYLQVPERLHATGHFVMSTPRIS